MEFSRRACALILLVCSSAALAADPPLLLPQAGLLVLRNGQVLEGEITRAGDFYLVTLGKTGEVRLPVTDVEMQCTTLAEAYEAKRDNIFPRGARGHLELAEWCLRHRLLGKSAEQLVEVMKLEPENPRIADLDRRLMLAAETPPEATARLPATAATVGADELDKALDKLPTGSVEKFAAVVQPILLNRCGANQCHGPNTKADFRLLKPPPGQSTIQRFTQRNLYATLQQIDPANPAASPLLARPLRRHGTALAAVFDKHSQRQLNELTAWVEQTFTQPIAAVPVTIAAGRPTTLSQAGPREIAAPASAVADNAATTHAMRPAVSDLSPPKTVSAEPFVPRDEFDPEIFNRRYLKKR